MRILIINSYYYPNMIGGTEHSLKLLAEGLTAIGHDVCIYSIDNLESDELIYENINEVNIFRGLAGLYDMKAKMRITKSRFKLWRNKIIEINNRGAVEELEMVIERFKPDIIHTNNLFGISAFIWKVIKLKGIPIIHTLRDYWMITPTYSLDYMKKNKFLNSMHKIYQWHYRRLSRFVDAVTAPSQFTLDKFIEYGYFSESKHVKISNCVEIDYSEMRDIIKKRNASNSNTIGFIFVGSLIPIKGIDKLIYTFMDIKNENISLTICGSGSLKDKILEACKLDNRIKYLGQLKESQLREVFLKNDVLIIPSVFDEPFGRVVIEANLYGLPVIGSRKGGIVEIINNIKSGVLFDIEDKNDFKEKIKLFSSRSYIKSFYPAILNGIHKYSLEEQIKEFLSLYSLILNV